MSYSKWLNCGPTYLTNVWETYIRLLVYRQRAKKKTTIKAAPWDDINFRF